MLKLVCLCTFILSFSFVSEAGTKKSYLKKSKNFKTQLTGGWDLPSFNYAVYITEGKRPLEVNTSQNCEEISEEWDKASRLVEADALGSENVNFMFVFNCEKTDDDTALVYAAGLFYALSEKGDEFLKQSYTPAYFIFYNRYWHFEAPIASTGQLSIEQWIGTNFVKSEKETNKTSGPLKGFLPLKWYMAGPFLKGLFAKLNEADGSGRREIIVQLAQQLRPDLSVEKINQSLNTRIEMVNSISVSYKPIFQLYHNTFVINFTHWKYSYKCPQRGKCFE